MEPETEPTKKHHRLRNTIIVIVVILVILTIAGSRTGTDMPETEPATETETESEQLTMYDLTPENASVTFGDLLTIKTNGKEIILKAKIHSNLTNRMTVTQNYDNVVNFVKDYAYTGFKSMEYWAVADMTNGNEEKVISFTVPADVVQGILDGRILNTNLEDYVEDLYIHQSLRDD